MANNRIPREWLDAEVTISREEFGRIMATEIAIATEAAKLANGENFANFVRGLFEVFATEVGNEVFRKLEEEELER